MRDSIVLNDTQIGPGAVLERAIVDKHVVVGPNARIGDGGSEKLAVVGKGSHLPEGFVVRAGGEVAHDVVASDLDSLEVPEGLSVYTKRRPWQVAFPRRP
ncbi:MAG: hypothetical protein R3B82_17880 [Sandaracinaceae bacterium]